MVYWLADELIRKWVLFMTPYKVDSCLYKEFIRSKNYALNNFWWNFTEVIMKANKVIPENLVAVRWLWEIYLYKRMEQPITAGYLEGCDWLLHRFIEVNFSKSTNSNQIFRNNFVCLYYYLCKISTQINECIFFIPMISWNELSITLPTHDDVTERQRHVRNSSKLVHLPPLFWQHNNNIKMLIFLQFK